MGLIIVKVADPNYNYKVKPMAFFNFLKTAIRVLTIALQVLATLAAAWDATQAGTAGA